MTATTARGYTYRVPADPADIAASTQALAASIDTDVTNAVYPIYVTSMGHKGEHIYANESIGASAINRTLSVRFRVPTTITPTRLRWYCITSSGNYDVGIINWTTRVPLWSKGSTASPAAGMINESIAAGAGVTLSPNTDYGFSFAFDNTTAKILGMTMYDSSEASTSYDGVVSMSEVTSWPITSPLPAHTATYKIPLMMLMV